MIDQKTLKMAIRTRTSKGATTLAKTLGARGEIEEILSLKEIKPEVVGVLVEKIFEREGLGGLRRVIEFCTNATSRREAVQKFISEIKKGGEVEVHGFFLAGVHYLNHERDPKTGRIDLGRIKDQEVDELVGRVLCATGLQRRLVEEYHALELEKIPLSQIEGKIRELGERYLEKYNPN